jgi:hypothetical protein
MEFDEVFTRYLVRGNLTIDSLSAALKDIHYQTPSSFQAVDFKYLIDYNFFFFYISAPNKYIKKQHMH